MDLAHWHHKRVFQYSLIKKKKKAQSILIFYFLCSANCVTRTKSNATSPKSHHPLLPSKMLLAMHPKSWKMSNWQILSVKHLNNVSKTPAHFLVISKESCGSKANEQEGRRLIGWCPFANVVGKAPLNAQGHTGYWTKCLICS